MTNDPTKPPRETWSEWIMEDQPTPWPMKAQGEIIHPDIHPDTHSQLVDLRHELAELRELLRSSNCKARFVLAFSVFNLVALGVLTLMWVLK